jgi:hypothetical protein
MPANFNAVSGSGFVRSEHRAYIHNPFVPSRFYSARVVIPLPVPVEDIAIHYETRPLAGSFARCAGTGTGYPYPCVLQSRQKRSFRATSALCGPWLI